MAQYTTALKDDFNTVRNAVATVLGSNSSGYGSPVNSYTVSKGDTISHNEYSALATDINVCYNHIANTDATLASVVQGGSVTWANFVTYQSAATYITNNRTAFNGASTTSADSITLSGGWGDASGRKTATMTGTIDWPSAAAMNYFFNQGNYITVTGGHGYTGGGDSKSEAFAALNSTISFNFTAQYYANPTGSAGGKYYMSTNPYGYNPPHTRNDYITVTLSNLSSTSLAIYIQCDDHGLDGNVLSNVLSELNWTFTRKLSNGSGITQYNPTVTFYTLFGSWTFTG